MKVTTKLPSNAKQAITDSDLNLISSLRLLKGKAYGSKGKTVLHYVAKYCDDCLVASFCINKLKVNPDAVTKKGKLSVLHVACKYGKLNLIKYFLELQNISKDVQDSEGETPLTTSLKYDQTDAALMIIHSSPDLSLKNKQGWTALHWSSKKGNLIVTTLLIQLGQNPNSLTKQNETSLHLSIESGCIYTIEALIKLVNPLHLSNKGTLIHHSQGLPDITDYLLSNTIWKDFPKLHLLLTIQSPVSTILKHASSELVLQALDPILTFDRADLILEMSNRHLIPEGTINQLLTKKLSSKCEALLVHLNRWQIVKKVLFVHKFSTKTTSNLPQGLLRELFMYI